MPNVSKIVLNNTTIFLKIIKDNSHTSSVWALKTSSSLQYFSVGVDSHTRFLFNTSVPICFLSAKLIFLLLSVLNNIAKTKNIYPWDLLTVHQKRKYNLQDWFILLNLWTYDYDVRSNKIILSNFLSKIGPLSSKILDFDQTFYPKIDLNFQNFWILITVWGPNNCLGVAKNPKICNCPPPLIWHRRVGHSTI